MLSLEEMLIRLLTALFLGGLIGFEREWIGKEAGIRTNILVASGAAIFTMIGLNLPYLISVSSENLSEILARNSGFLAIIANIVVGIGFLGAGIIVKQEVHVRGLTTAAVVWFTSSIGILSGLGHYKFAFLSTFLVLLILILLRKINIFKFFGHQDPQVKD